MRSRLASSTGQAANLGSALAAILTATAGACAGGVCAVGVQAGSALFTASSSSFAAMAAAAGAAELEGLPVATHASFPWWLKIAIVALLFSTLYTVALLRDRRFLAISAAMGGVFAVVAELRWLPVGQGGQLLAIGAGLIPLVAGPLLLRWGAALARWGRFIGGLSAILAVSGLGLAIWLQVADGWQPCPLCWIQRIALFLVFLLGSRIWIRGWNQRDCMALLASTLAGLGAVFLQLGEMHAASLDHEGFCALLSHTSCAVAGSQILGPWSIALDAGALFGVLFLLGYALTSIQHHTGDS
ncbi:MAG: disulfide bond formation protein B [Acidithiobacillus sp.]|nr:disulfide bond formation protein B [Acidithiobacillus sp.]